MTDLDVWLANRGTFKEVEFGSAKLQIVSLSEDLIKGLGALPTYEMMFEFVAEHGLSSKRNRLSDDEDKCEDIPVIWKLSDFAESKLEIVDAICELSGIESILADKLALEAKENEEMAELEAAENTNVINGDATIPDIDLGQLHADAALNP